MHFNHSDAKRARIYWSGQKRGKDAWRPQAYDLSKIRHNSPKVIHLLKQHHRWRRAKIIYSYSIYSHPGTSVTNDAFANHLLDVHKTYCSSCTDSERNIPNKLNKPDVHLSNSDASVEQVLVVLKKAVQVKLRNIENSFKKLNNSYATLHNKVELLSSMIRNTTSKILDSDSEHSDEFESNLSIIRLNKESDFPQGCWLGDPSKPLVRVRCHISPTDLFYINETCNTPEKMALCLLDYLFDRETQAESNISGHGRHRKKQLNPLFIYGIQCHLNFKFGLDSKTWSKIKLNLDSKCRTAHRRKLKALPVAPKPSLLGNSLTSDSEPSDFDVATQETGFATQEVAMEVDKVQTPVTESQIIQTEQGEIQIIRATPEEIAHLKDIHQFEILTDEHLLKVIENQTDKDQ